MQAPPLIARIEAARSAERAGEWDRALAAYEAAFAALPAGGDARACADLLRWIGTLRRERGDLELAEELYAASLAVAEASGLAGAAASALNCLAIVEQLRGRLPEAEALYRRARAEAEHGDDPRLRAMLDQNLGCLANIRGDVGEALQRYRKALEVFRNLSDGARAVGCLNNIGMALLDQRDWEGAEACFDEAFTLADGIREPGMLGHIALGRTELALKRRQFAQAREHCDLAFEVFGRLGARAGQAEAQKFYGVLNRETGKLHLAETHFSLAVSLAHQSHARLIEAEAESECAMVHLLARRNAEALRCLSRAHQLFRTLNARRGVSDVDRRMDQLERTFLHVMQAWAESIESKDAYTAGHCQRVADYACRLAAAAGVTGRDLTWFRMGALLHDVGKIEVPESILNKPGPLTEQEWTVMRNHPVAGDRIVARLDFPWDIRPIVRSHHEHWVGTGYPDGLAGREIPLHARILCIADVYDALTTARSYRPALSHDEALRIMERDSGRIFDPQLFATFRALLADDTPAAA